MKIVHFFLVFRAGLKPDFSWAAYDTAKAVPSRVLSHVTLPGAEAPVFHAVFAGGGACCPLSHRSASYCNAASFFSQSS